MKMDSEFCENDISVDPKSNNQVNLEELQDPSEGQLYSGDTLTISQTIPNDENDKLHEMGEALEIAENRCNTLKEQLDQMRHLYRERSTIERSSSNERRAADIKAAAKQPILRQNSDAISTDNSGAAVLTINNILNGITNSINRLSELHSYMEPNEEESIETPQQQPYNGRKKSKHTKAAENEFASSENRNARFVDRRSSSWLFNEKKKEQKKRTNKRKPNTSFESGSLTQIKKAGTRNAKPSTREDPSTTSVKNRKRLRRLPKASKKPVPLRRPGFAGNTLSNNHLVEIYHNAAVDYADSEEYFQHEGPPKSHEARSYMRGSHADIKTKYNRREIQMPNVTACDSKEDESIQQAVSRPDAVMRALSPIKEQEISGETPQQSPPCQQNYFYNRGYQSPTISSKMKQVARGYFRNFSCKSIPFCAAKSTSPSHNIGINIQQVMSIIKGRQSVNGISPTLAHNIGLAAERLNNESLPAMVSNYSSRYAGYNYPGYTNYQYTSQMPCPMQCSMNYQQLQEMATEVPNEEVDDDYVQDNEKERIEVDCMKNSNEIVSWSIDPTAHNNCTCANPPGVGFNQVVDKYQNYVPPSNYIPNSMYDSQQNMNASLMQKHASKKYRNIRSVYAQYNETNRKCKKQSLGELSTDSAHSNLPLQGKEKILKGVLINLHEEFASLSDKYDELTKIVDDEKQTNPNNVEKLENLEKKLNEKEMEIQMVMSLYTEVVNLKQQVKALKEKAGVSTALLEHQKAQCQRFQQAYPAYTGNVYQQFPQFMHGRQRDGKSNAAVHLTKLLRQIQAYQEVTKTGGK